MTAGLLSAPRRTYRAFVRGRCVSRADVNAEIART
jgi:hypothetical protein